MDPSELAYKSVPAVVSKYQLSEKLSDTIPKEKSGSKVSISNFSLTLLARSR